MNRTATRPTVSVTTGGKGVAAHAGARLLCELADDLGLSSALSEAMAPTKQRRSGHDRGQVLVDLAVAIADGATTITDLRVLSDQPGLFGDVASVPTAWRTLEAVDAAALDRIASARASARAEAWAAGLDPGFYVIDLDATLVGAHSDKEGAAPNYKHGFGFHPLIAFLDATGEPLAARLRPGNAAANRPDDHIEVLDEALGQLPVDPTGTEVIVRTDTAGCSHRFIDACSERNVRFAVGHKLSAELAAVVMEIPENRWQATVSADGTEMRDSGEVAEITDLVDLSGWGPGTRMIARRELPHPGPSSVSPTSRVTATRCSSPTTPIPTSASSKPSIGAGGAVSSGSATPRTPGSPTCPRPASPSTPPGWPWCSSPAIYSPG